MDFSRGRGHYTRLNSQWLPRFGLAYLAEEHFGTLESGRVHSEVRYRWEQGDADVRHAIGEVARCAEQGREALQAGDTKRLGQLMNRNFDLRRKLFGDEALGEHNLALVEIARSAGFAAKLPGSSGAALILLEGDAEAEALLNRTYNERGYHYVSIKVR
jgi:glucuronokinase